MEKLTEKQQRKLIEKKIISKLENLTEASMQDMVKDYVLTYLKNSKFSQELMVDVVNELAKRLEFKVILK